MGFRIYPEPQSTYINERGVKRVVCECGRDLRYTNYARHRRSFHETPKTLDLEVVKPKDPGDHLSAEERKVLDILTKGSTTVPDLEKLLDTSAQDIILYLDGLWVKGYKIRHDRTTKLVTLIQAPEEFAPLTIKLEKEPERPITGEINIGVLHGTVAGSKYAKWRLLATAYEIFKKMEVSFVIHLGDWIAGIPTRERADEIIGELANPSQQADFVVECYPHAPVKTYGISGPRDLSILKKRKGFNPLKYISEQRRVSSEGGEQDIVYRGDLTATFWIRKLGIKKGILIKVQNIGERRAYAATYPLQGIVETIGGALPTVTPRELEYDALVVLTAAGGITDHIPEYNVRGRIHAYSVPTLQGITPWQERHFHRGAAPVLGASILRIRYDPNTWELLEDGIVFDTINLTDYQDEDNWKEDAFALAKGQNLELLPEETRVLTYLSERNATLGELSRLTIGGKGIGKKRGQAVIAHLKEVGYPILTPNDPEQRASNEYKLVPGVRKDFPPFDLTQIFAKETTVGIVSDPHYTSKWQLPSLVNLAFEYARKAGAKAILVPGDITDGVPGAGGGRNREKKTFIPEGRNQVNYTVKHLPSGKDFGEGILVVNGDHDLWSWDLAGWDPAEELALRRKDIRYLGDELEGQLSGFVEIDGLLFELLHMTGGVAYALSYGAQKRLEAEIRDAYTRSSKKILQALIIGGGHIANMMLYKGVVVVHGGGFQARTPDYMTPRGLTPWVGTMILTLTQDVKGRITKITTCYVNLAPLIKLPDRP